MLNIAKLEGTWHIHYSNFPMWLKGDEQRPTFTYNVINRHKLSDTVSYSKNGRMKYIRGVDTLQPDNTFVWRGRGLLKIAKSVWSIKEAAPDGSWMLIAFEKTLFTSAGYDLIARKEVNRADIANIYANLLEQGKTSALTALD